MMAKKPKFLTLEQVEAIHKRSLVEHGGSQGLRDAGGLESAVIQPQHGLAYIHGGIRKSQRAGRELPATFRRGVAPLDDSEISREWRDEIRSRANDIDNGKVKLIDGEEVIRELHAI